MSGTVELLLNPLLANAIINSSTLPTTSNSHIRFRQETSLPSRSVSLAFRHDPLFSCRPFKYQCTSENHVAHWLSVGADNSCRLWIYTSRFQLHHNAPALYASLACSVCRILFWDGGFLSEEKHSPRRENVSRHTDYWPGKLECSAWQKDLDSALRDSRPPSNDRRSCYLSCIFPRIQAYASPIQPQNNAETGIGTLYVVQSSWRPLATWIKARVLHWM